jgi:hypothetical protein
VWLCSTHERTVGFLVAKMQKRDGYDLIPKRRNCQVNSKVGILGTGDTVDHVSEPRPQAWFATPRGGRIEVEPT